MGPARAGQSSARAGRPLVNARAMTLEEFYSPNKWLPFGAALAFHMALLAWDPTILKASAYLPAMPLINIKMLDHLPVIEPVKPAARPPAHRAAVKKARKSGLSMKAKAHPVTVSRHKAAPKVKTAPRPFLTKITVPKFVPREIDEPIAASPMPGRAPAAARRMTQAFAPAPKLSGKTRGVRAGDIHFELSDRGSLAASAGQVVAIPLGEERGETAALPSAAVIHDAPRGPKAIAGYRFTPGQGSGSGELSGKDRGDLRGYHGAVKADMYVEGSLQGASGDGRGARVVSGKGFEIGGPVGDRKIIHRRLPEYPSWAEEKGISALVKIYFTVRSDGTLRSNIRILRSSGYAELDDLAKQALLAWRFSATSGDSSSESAWGVITFRFTLS
jgi:TonB family protein